MNTKEVLQHYIDKRVYYSEFLKMWTYSFVNKNTMELWYNEARNLWKVPLTFEDFSFCIEERRTRVFEPWWKNYHRRGWYTQTNGTYRRQKHHEKKVLSEKEILKREWRRKVKDPRDQGSNLTKRNGWTLLQRDSNKVERRKVKIKIKSKRWETYPESSSYWELRCNGDCIRCETSKIWEYNYPDNDWDDYTHPRRRESLSL